jgi:hypothetical protein
VRSGGKDFCHSRPTPSRRQRGERRRASNGRSTASFRRVPAGGRTLPSILHETLHTGWTQRQRPRRAHDRVARPQTPSLPRLASVARIPLLHHRSLHGLLHPARNPRTTRIAVRPLLTDSLFLALLPLLSLSPNSACSSTEIHSPFVIASWIWLTWKVLVLPSTTTPRQPTQPLNLRRARLNPKSCRIPSPKLLACTASWHFRLDCWIQHQVGKRRPATFSKRLRRCIC